MTQGHVEGILKLFSADTAARNIMGSIPHRKDILAVLINTKKLNTGELDLSRPRTRLGQVMTNTKGEVIAYMGISIAQKAKPTNHEHWYVWGVQCPETISGLFIRMMITAKKERSKGYGSILFSEAKRLANTLGLHIYCDTHESNLGMRSFLQNEGGVVERFWCTKKETKMVRYCVPQILHPAP
ncbi:MAG: hypothetical protein UY04_C0004G0023 [Parcubacteria group bacterium GW2011_GWA2_47_7]|nr:MAG: hypothetical protein UY04_C0004G0023 [Parcubacteria group bacterium GW2011_GWA2_47_7]